MFRTFPPSSPTHAALILLVTILTINHPALAQFPGACCTGNNCQVVGSSSSCTNGTFHVGAISCAIPPCLGACCRPDSCSVVSGSSCVLSPFSPGVYQGVGTTCSSPCPAVVACCDPDGSCAIRTAAACAARGSSASPASSCQSANCPTPPVPGVCCRGFQCALLTQEQCGEHIFRGTGSCSAPLACCLADHNRSGTLSVQDLFDYLEDYFGRDPAADFNRSGELGVQDIFDFLAAYFTGCP